MAAVASSSAKKSTNVRVSVPLALRWAVAGIGMSGVTVARTIRCTSSGATPAASIACRPASMAKGDNVSSSPATRRSLIPLRVRIHSSEVSTIFSRSALVSTPSGTAEPTPAIRIPNASGWVMRRLLAWRRAAG